MVLLKVETMCAWPRSIFLRSLLLTRDVLFFVANEYSLPFYLFDGPLRVLALFFVF